MNKEIIAKELVIIAKSLLADDYQYQYDPKHESRPASNWEKTEKGWEKGKSDNDSLVKPSDKVNQQYVWLKHQKEKDSLAYRVTKALLKGEKDIPEKLNIDTNQYLRILRSIDNLNENGFGGNMNGHEEKWRTEKYSEADAEEWAKDNLKKVFKLKK